MKIGSRHVLGWSPQHAPLFSLDSKRIVIIDPEEFFNKLTTPNLMKICGRCHDIKKKKKKKNNI